MPARSSQRALCAALAAKSRRRPGRGWRPSCSLVAAGAAMKHSPPCRSTSRPLPDVAGAVDGCATGSVVRLAEMAVRYLVPTGPVRGGTSPTTHRPTAHLLTEYGKPPYIVTGAAATLTCSSSKGYGQLPSILPKQPVVCACEGRSPSIAAPPVRSGSHSGGSGGRCRREHWRKRQKGALSVVGSIAPCRRGRERSSAAEV